MGWFRLGIKVHIEKGNVVLSFCSDWNWTCFSGKMLNYCEQSCELIYKKQCSQWLVKENCNGKNVHVISEMSSNSSSLRDTESLWYCPSFFSSQRDTGLCWFQTYQTYESADLVCQSVCGNECTLTVLVCVRVVKWEPLCVAFLGCESHLWHFWVRKLLLNPRMAKWKGMKKYSCSSHSPFQLKLMKCSRI